MATVVPNRHPMFAVWTADGNGQLYEDLVFVGAQDLQTQKDEVGNVT